MKGPPKHWNTRKDVLVALENWPEQTKKYLESLLDTLYTWRLVKKLKEDEEGIDDDTHKVRVIKNDQDEIEERYQLEYKQDPYSKINRLGLSEQETQDLIKNE